MIVVAVCFGSELLNGAQRRTGSDVAWGDHKFLPNLQGPLFLESIQYQDPLHGDVIGISNGNQRLIRLHLMDDLAICIWGLRHDHAQGSRCGIAYRVLTWDE